MPWSVTKDERCPASKPWGVVKDDDNELEGCHVSKEDAQKQQAALYANERSAPRENLVRGLFPMEVRAAEEKDDKVGTPHLSGYFNRFDEWAEIDSMFEGRFLERHAPGSMAKTLKENRDRIQMTFQHGMDPELGDKVIADIKELRSTREGPYYDAELLDGLPPLIEAGLMRGKYGVSFRFSVVKDAWTYPEEPSDYNPEMLPERVVNESKVYEFGPVTYAAFAGATGEYSVRSLTDQYRMRTVIQQPERLETTLSEMSQALPPEPASATPTEGSRAASSSTSLLERIEAVTPTPPAEPAPPETRKMDPEETPAPPAKPERRTLEEWQDRQTEIRGRLETIDRDNAGGNLDPATQAEWDNLSKEMTANAEVIKHLEERRQTLAAAGVLAERSTKPETGYVAPPSAGEDRFGRPTFTGKGQILSPSEIRAVSRTREDEVRLLKDNARRAIDAARFGHVRGVTRTQLQERVDTLLDTVVEDAGQEGMLARRILVTSTPVYDRAFGKHMAQVPLDNDESRALSLTGASGGFAVPFDLDPTILGTGALGVHPFRRIARVIPITGDEWRGVTSGAITSAYEAEATQTTDNAPTLAQPIISTEKAQAWVPFSIEIGMDWSGLRSEMTTLLQESKDALEATKFAVGTGTNEPQGVIVGATTTVNATTGQTFDLEDVYRLTGALPERYQPNARIVGHRAIFNLVRQFNLTGQSEPWKDLNEGTVDPAGVVGTLLGYPAHYASAMASVTTTGSLFLIVGDFSRFVIIDRVGLDVELVPHVFGANQRPTGQRGLYAFWRNGSEVINADAFRVLIGVA